MKALANETRLDVLRVLDSPGRHFSKQESADPIETGVCVQLLAEHFAVSQPTMSRHIELLKRAGFIETLKQRQWTYCSRNEAVLADYTKWFTKSLKVKY